MIAIDSDWCSQFSLLGSATPIDVGMSYRLPSYPVDMFQMFL